MSYVRLGTKTNTETGFITHNDWNNLSFERHDPIVIVTGDEKTVAAWAKRVGGTIIKDDEALTEIKTQELAGVESEITQKQVEISTLTATKIVKAEELSAMTAEVVL